MADEKIFNKGDYTGADLIMEDGKFYVEDNGVRTAECVVKPYRGNRHEIHLQPNSSNRKIWDYADACEKCKDGGRIKLLYKPTIKLGTVTRTNIPNAKLVEYLDEADKAEHCVIIVRAKAKLMAKIAKLQKQLEEVEQSDAE